MNTVDKYRKAAMELFGANEKEAANYIRNPKNDPGKWSPHALAIIYLEPDGRFPEDTFCIPDALDYYGRGFDNCIALAQAAGVGFIEYINPAVAAVYD